MQRSLSCPHCGGQMNSLGAGALKGSYRYMCLGCHQSLQNKELLVAQVLRTGNGGFGFVAVEAMPFLGQVHFRHTDVRGPAVRLGDLVLVLLEDRADGQQGKYARAVYPGVVTAPQVRPDVVHRSHPGSPRAQARRWGVVSTLKAPDWGFLQDIESGESVFVHASNCIGPVLRQGQRVVYTPSRSQKGLAALDVRAA